MNTSRPETVVSDSSVLIDLCKLDLLPLFFDLPRDFLVPLAVWEELDAHKRQLAPFVQKSRLQIDDTVSLATAHGLQEKHGRLSLPDCSAILLAQKRGAILLTSDKAMRKLAVAMRLECHRHKWAFLEIFAAFPHEKATLREKAIALNHINPKLAIPPVIFADLLNALK